MGQNSPIEWTHHTFNPWWGCIKVSPGCTHCYAETWANRYGHDLWGPRTERRVFGHKHWQEPLKWNRQATEQGIRMRVFCASMADVFEDHPMVIAEREKLWKLIEATPALDWLLLTKRPENMLRFTPWVDQWPTNIWAMTSVENQEQAQRRIPELLRVPAAVKALSVEPLLGAVELSPWLSDIQWVIVGGESGPGARPMHPHWVRNIRDDCQQYAVAFFFKQWGAWAPIEYTPTTRESQSTTMLTHQGEAVWMRRMGKKLAGREFEQRTWNDFPQLQVLDIFAK